MFLLLLLLMTLPCVFSQEKGGHCCSGGGHDKYNCHHWCLYDQKQYDYCTPKYIPGGDKIILEPIEAPTATLKDYSNAQEASNTGFVVTLAADINDFVPAEVRFFAEKFAKGLGIFGSIISGIGSFKKPTPNDIIDACNKAIAELTDEVNNQFTNMQGYVDQGILQAQTNAMSNFLDYFGSKFVNCLEEVTEDLFMNCLVHTEQDIHAASSSFMRFQSRLQDDSFVPTVDDVKRMEMEFITFMNYATLRTINLLVMYDTYNNRTGTTADRQTCRFLTSLQRELREFVEYTRNFYNAIIVGHNQDTSWQYFLTNVEKGRRLEEHNEHLNWIYTEGWFPYRLSMMLLDSDTYYCTVNLKIRHESLCQDQYCEYRYNEPDCTIGTSSYSMMQCRARDNAYATYKDYTTGMVEAAEYYWKPQTLDRTTPWKEIADQVEEKRKAKGCDAIEATMKKEEL